MKNIGLTFLLLLCVCCVQANKIVKAPYFMARNTNSLEIEKVTLGKDTTWLEVKIYDMPGEGVRIDSAAVLRVSGTDYAYLGNTGLNRIPWSIIPASGVLTATLKFEPVPMETGSFDFIEIPGNEKGWIIYDVRLDGQKPRVEIPARLQQQQPDSNLPLPAPELKCGKSVIKGQILGYNPKYTIKFVFYNTHWFFPDYFGKQIPIADDGTFCYEVDVLMPCGGTLQMAGFKINLFLVPDGELNITLNLPEIFMSQSHVFGNKQQKNREKRVWFEGDYAGMNTELLDVGELMSLRRQEDFYPDICGMTPLAFKKYVFKHYNDYRQKLDNKTDLSRACHTYVRTNLDMDFFSTIYTYKSTISYAPMFSGKKGVKRADMTVDSIPYFKEILELDVLHSSYQKYYKFYIDFVGIATGSLRDRFVQEPAWKDILLCERASQSLNKQLPLTEEERLTVDSISNPELKQVFLDRSNANEAQLVAAKNKTGYSIVEVGMSISADSLLQVITRPYRGKMVLIDMWNTWCAPCLRAMKSLQPLKEDLKEVVYLYIADGTSPEGKWRLMIPDIHGIHYRITNGQSVALGKLYEYSGIPTYFIVNREGEISYKVTGFPGVEILKKELTKQGE